VPLVKSVTVILLDISCNPCCLLMLFLSDDAQMVDPSGPGPAASPIVMYPICVPGAFPQQAGDDQAQGPGIYAIQQNQLAVAMGMRSFAPTTLVPLTYKIPT
jgi:hypothetical protein